MNPTRPASLRFRRPILAIAAPLLLCLVQAQASAVPADCTAARDCLERALTAMGGRTRLETVKSLQLDVIGHTALAEQSYRQAPFITSYERDHVTVDLVKQRVLSARHTVWPESDPKEAESDASLVVTAEGGAYHDTSGDRPCSAADLDSTRQMLALGPMRVLLTASAASDLRLAAPEMLRSTRHLVLTFTWGKVPVRILLNSYNYLPDAVETTQIFRDFWYFWGDVQQRVYFDNWQLRGGIEYPTNEVIERNGLAWSSAQVLDVGINAPIDEKQFVVDPAAAKRSLESRGWKRQLRASTSTSLSPGIDLYSDSWNATIVKQQDGIVILETPISESFAQDVFARARDKYPGIPIKAVVSTSDSWPHVGGLRFDVAQHLPIYILDLNRPLLDRMMAAPHALDPDALEGSPAKADWKIVSHKTTVGSGDNRMELYPLRGASTERQYMVYFPAHHLLYASDTLVINPNHTLYDPELMHEVLQEVEREHLTVDTVYAMHQTPVPWHDVVELVGKARL